MSSVRQPSLRTFFYFFESHALLVDFSRIFRHFVFFFTFFYRPADSPVFLSLSHSYIFDGKRHHYFVDTPQVSDLSARQWEDFLTLFVLKRREYFFPQTNEM